MWRCAGTLRLRYDQILLATDGVEIRPFTATDVPRLLTIVRDPEIVRFSDLPDVWRTEPGALEYVCSLPDLASRGRRIDLAIGTPGSGALIGHVALRGIDWRKGRAGVGTWLASESRGRGIAGKSLRLLAAWAFSELGLQRLDADPDWNNVASQRMLERIGFEREGWARLGTPPRRTVILYSLLSDQAAASEQVAGGVLSRSQP